MSRAGTAFVTSSNSRVSSHKAYLRVLLQYVHYGVLRCTTVYYSVYRVQRIHRGRGTDGTDGTDIVSQYY